MNMAVAIVLARGGDVEAATALILAFHIYARGAEIDGLQDFDVALPGDPRLINQACGSILLWDTKAGRMQSVLVDDQLVLEALAAQRARNKVTQPQGGQFFSSLRKTGPESLLARFKAAQRKLGFPEPLWVRHSERHGGATHDYELKIRSEAAIQLRGRWALLQTMKVYLNGAQAQIQALVFPPAVELKVAQMGDLVGALRQALGI
jgi:hypothetical protein